MKPHAPPAKHFDRWFVPAKSPRAARAMGLLGLLACSCSAQVQQAWVNSYNSGFTNLEHAPAGMTLDSSGNVYVVGSSQDAGSNYDYVVLKYTSDGALAWASRYASLLGGDAKVVGFAFDPRANCYITGTAGTVKVLSDGRIAWISLTSGNGLAVDTNGTVYLSGVSSNEFSGFVLSANGAGGVTLTPVLSWDSPDLGWGGWTTLTAVDQGSNLYFAGPVAENEGHPEVSPWLVKYPYGGGYPWACALWTDFGDPEQYIGIGGPVCDNSGNVYADCWGMVDEFGRGQVVKVSPEGQLLWLNTYRVQGYGLGGVVGSCLALDAAGNLFLSGPGGWPLAGTVNLTLKVDGGTGDLIWGNSGDPGLAVAAAVDRTGSFYVTGTTQDAPPVWTTVKYNGSGVKLWSTTYAGSAGQGAHAVAIAAASDGSLYVSGYCANAWGGVDLVTIKYVQLPAIEAPPGGPLVLRASANPCQTNYIAASTNLLEWMDLASVVADTNGICQYVDTNFPRLPLRFYRWQSKARFDN